MNTKLKIFEITLALVILIGIAYVPFSSTNQTAAVGFIFSKNNTNDKVLLAQTKLKALGLYGGNLSGIFGIKTRFAIYRFQEITGLSNTGILDIPTQNLLFSLVINEPGPETEIEYLDVSYTDDGNAFLADWVKYFVGLEGKKNEWSGLLTFLSGEFFIDTTNGEQYIVKNISSRDLSAFVGKNINISGLILPAENNFGTDTIFINYIEAGEEIYPTAVGFSENGNEYLKKWVNQIYGENHELQGFMGNLSIGRKVVYASGGNITRAFITLPDGTEYNIENISSTNIEDLAGRDIMIRGLLLENLNSLGRKTIAINYVIAI